MSKSITLAKFIKIGMDSHAPEGELEGGEVVGAIAYIRKRGAEDSRRLMSVSDAIQPTTIRIQSLIAKGQVFKFDGYSKCYNAVRILAWHFGRLEVVAAVIAYGDLNWDNPEVADQRRNAMDIAADDLEKKLREENVVVLTFFIETYERIYGKKPEAARVALSNSHGTPQQSALPCLHVTQRYISAKNRFRSTGIPSVLQSLKSGRISAHDDQGIHQTSIP